MEIEKKYLVEKLPDDLSGYKKKEIEQAYLCGNPTVRVRKSNDDYILTYKSKKDTEDLKKISGAAVNEEIEMPLTKEAYEHLIEKKDDHKVKKTRYIIPIDEDHNIELDVFHGRLKGLVMAEVEFLSAEDARDFVPPAWFKKDVSLDKRFSNKSLSKLESLEGLI